MRHRSKHAAIESLFASLVGAAMALALTLAPAPAAAKGTTAGTSIRNTATASFTFDGRRVAVEESHELKVQEILDVTVTPLSTERVAVNAGQKKSALAFRVTNTGNGSEPFRLTARTDVAGDNFDPDRCDIALDANDNATYDASSDTPYVAGETDPVLAPDASAVVFLLCDIPGVLADNDHGDARLDARAATATGELTPGTVYEDGGGEDVDAIVGLTTAFAGAQGGFLVAVTPPSFFKSQEVRDRFGGTTPGKDAIITYTLVAALTGGGISYAVITDPIPAGTSYVTGSIELSADGSSFIGLTDAQDGDQGRFTGEAIEVALGDAPTNATRTVRFKVRINE